MRSKLNEDLWYFAYGSNMNGERMKRRIGRMPGRIPGVLRDWRLKFNKASRDRPGTGFANIMACPGDAVEGVLYAVTEEELQKLDRCEGVPAHYVRRQINVERWDTGEVVAAVTYVANPDKVRDGLRPTREYLGHLLAGAGCLSDDYLRRLRAVETVD